MFAAAAICSLAILVKLPAIIIGIPFIYMSWKVYGARLFLQSKLWVFFALSLILPVAWYVYIYDVATSNYPYHMFGSGGIGMAGWDWYLGIWRRTVVDGLTPIVSVIAAFGIAIRSRKKFGRMFHWWLVAIVIFIVFAAQGNGRHPWYQLPMVPVAAAFAGQACSFGFRKIKGLVGNDIILGIIPVVFFVILGYLSYSYLKPWYIPWGRPLMEAGIELERTTPLDALVMIADDGDPTGIYYSKRKGWHFPQGAVLPWEPYPVNDKEAISEVERRRAQGASYLVFTKYTQWWLDYYVDFRKYLDAHYQRVNSTDHYVIFTLK